MCTAISMNTNNHYFGRTLDLDRSYGEEVCVVPRLFPFRFRNAGEQKEHFAVIGMATVAEGMPLFYDGANEHGLAMAGLNFPGNAYYAPLQKGTDNIAPFEFIPWILGQCKTISEAKTLLNRVNLADISFNEQFPSSPLHWMIADENGSLVVESQKDGLHVYDNPVGVLTNNPPFPYQLNNLAQYDHLRTNNRCVTKNKTLPYTDYCQGLGAVGLPGDVSSMSRFVRGAFGVKHSVCEENEHSSVSRFFHVLSSVQMIKGVCVTDENTLDFTGYSACMNTFRGRYYYTTYENQRITCVDMHQTDLNSNQIGRFPLLREQSIHYQNG